MLDIDRILFFLFPSTYSQLRKEKCKNFPFVSLGSYLLPLTLIPSYTKEINVTRTNFGSYHVLFGTDTSLKSGWRESCLLCHLHKLHDLSDGRYEIRCHLHSYNVQLKRQRIVFSATRWFRFFWLGWDLFNRKNISTPSDRWCMRNSCTSLPRRISPRLWL